MKMKQIALDTLSTDEKNYIKYTLIHSGKNKSYVNGIMKYLDISIDSLTDAQALLDKAPVPLHSSVYRYRQRRLKNGNILSLVVALFIFLIPNAPYAKNYSKNILKQ